MVKQNFLNTSERRFGKVIRSALQQGFKDKKAQWTHVAKAISVIYLRYQEELACHKSKASKSIERLQKVVRATLSTGLSSKKSKMCKAIQTLQWTKS